jgi:hypothetical protein
VRPACSARVRRAGLLRGAGIALVGATLGLALLPGRAFAAVAVVVITPVAGPAAPGPFEDGEVVKLSVKSNSTFTPGTRVNILECADPQGTSANLPKDIGTCDGLTIQPDTVLVQPDGAIAVAKYTIYRLPNPILGEQANAQPVCDDSNQCVLYVGQDQNDFTQPKIFSTPFTVAASTTAPSSVTTSTDPSSSLAPSPQAGAAGSSSTGSNGPASLAFTGTGSWLPWVLAVGGVLVVAGSLGRRRMRAHP